MPPALAITRIRRFCVICLYASPSPQSAALFICPAQAGDDDQGGGGEGGEDDVMLVDEESLPDKGSLSTTSSQASKLRLLKLRPTDSLTDSGEV